VSWTHDQVSTAVLIDLVALLEGIEFIDISVCSQIKRLSLRVHNIIVSDYRHCGDWSIMDCPARDPRSLAFMESLSPKTFPQLNQIYVYLEVCPLSEEEYYPQVEPPAHPAALDDALLRLIDQFHLPHVAFRNTRRRVAFDRTERPPELTEDDMKKLLPKLFPRLASEGRVSHGGR
jgi:hypothetical protein